MTLYNQTVFLQWHFSVIAATYQSFANLSMFTNRSPENIDNHLTYWTFQRGDTFENDACKASFLTTRNQFKFGRLRKSLLYNHRTQETVLKVFVNLSAPLHGNNNHIFADIRVNLDGKFTAYFSIQSTANSSLRKGYVYSRNFFREGATDLKGYSFGKYLKDAIIWWMGELFTHRFEACVLRSTALFKTWQYKKIWKKWEAQL